MTSFFHIVLSLADCIVTQVAYGSTCSLRLWETLAYCSIVQATYSAHAKTDVDGRVSLYVQVVRTLDPSVSEATQHECR